MQNLDGKNSEEYTREGLSSCLEEVENLTDEEIERQLGKLKKQKAAGEDEVSNEAIIYSRGNLRTAIKQLIKDVWKGKGLPARWRKGVISPIYKKGKKNDPKSYRGITLLDTTYKIYASILDNKLKEEIKDKNILPDTQAGFREARSVTDNIYLLNYLIEEKIKKKGGKLYAFFADLKSAFDTIDRELLWKIMHKKKINRHIIERIQEIYNSTSTTVKAMQVETETFYITKGVRQGCPLSPTLFAIYLSDLDDYMAQGQSGGAIVGNRKIWNLAYADDIVLLATNETEMKEVLKRFKLYAEKKKLTLNTEKSKVMIFKKREGRKRKEEIKWKWGEEDLQQVKEFKYLGYHFQTNNKPEVHIKNLAKRATIAMKETWSICKRKFNNNFERKMRLFNSLVGSILLNGSEIWGWREFKKIESIQETYVRWSLGLHRTVPDYILLTETGLGKLRIESGKRAANYEAKIRMKTENQL